VIKTENTVVVEIEIDAELKESAEAVFSAQGYTLEEALILFLKETIRLGRLPFTVSE